MNLSKTLKIFLLVIGLSGVAILAACGGSDSDPTPAPTAVQATPTATTVPVPTAVPTQVVTPAPQPTTPSAPPSGRVGELQEIEVTLKDNFFPKQTDFVVGDTIRATISNEGSVEHRWISPELDILWYVDQGETKTFEWTVPNTPGEYICGCFLGGEDPAAHENMDGVCRILAEAP